MQERVLIHVTEIMNDLTKTYDGELGCVVDRAAEKHLEDATLREALAKQLEDLAKKCRANEGPFQR